MTEENQSRKKQQTGNPKLKRHTGRKPTDKKRKKNNVFELLQEDIVTKYTCKTERQI